MKQNTTACERKNLWCQSFESLYDDTYDVDVNTQTEKTQVENKE